MNLEALFPEPPEIARIVEAWAVSDRRVGDEALMRFVLGWSPEEEADDVRGWMVHSAAYRKRVLALRQELTEGPVCDRDFRAFIGRELSPAVQVVRKWRSGSRSLEAALKEEGRLLRGAVAEAVGRMMRPSVPFATTRGDDTILDLEVSVSPSSELHALAQVPHFEGRMLTLEFQDPILGAIALGEAVVRSGDWSLMVEGFGTTFAVAPGAIPIDRLRLVASNERAEGGIPTHWSVAVQTPSSQEVRVSVPRAREPYVERDEKGVSLMIPLKFDPAMAEAYAGYAVYAYLSSDPRPIPLGRRSVAEVASEGGLRVDWFETEEPAPAEVLTLRLKPAPVA